MGPVIAAAPAFRADAPRSYGSEGGGGDRMGQFLMMAPERGSGASTLFGTGGDGESGVIVAKGTAEVNFAVRLVGNRAGA
ncbi:hypothetical protein [Streptomyces sp. TLI_146]|uniref:hypothetical protein n=1 Tax=Streptomyces sp. TLI_146 TaxID=1938858 RepID=UPI000C70C64C|nr:hypothetical protein [Streptomyces sp. TLI_146]PKV84381.1 hypothetical protein BX283_1901 [Streptomyces sp. TLI_146]